MRRGKCFVQVQVHHVGAEIAGTCEAHQRIHIRAIHIEQRAFAVQDIGRRHDMRFENAQRIGVRDHQPGHVFGDGFLQRRKIQQALFVRPDVFHHVARDGRRGRVGAVRGVGNQDLLARVALLFEQRADQQDTRQLALRARRRLQRDRIHAGDLQQRGFKERHHFHCALRQRFRLIRMRPRQTFRARHEFVHARIVFHGAGSQRVHAVIDGVVPG